METETDREIYFRESKENIDNYLHTGKYSGAFGLLISVLNRLDDKERSELIKYYHDDLFNFLASYSYSQSHFYNHKK
jgi:hypothetical protein